MSLVDSIPSTRSVINVLGSHLKDDNFTELHNTVKDDSFSEVQKLLENKTPINAQTKNGVTSLLLSCLHAVDTSISKLLIESGADVNIPDNVNFTPLLAATMVEKIEIVDLLLKSGANINHQDDCEYTALHYAIENDNVELVELLLQSRADTSLSDCNGWNPLMMALHDHEACAELILPYTEDLNAVAYNGWSALMLAASNMSKEIIMKLIERGADVNINVDGVMPVTLALERWDPTIFDYLWGLTDVEVLKEGGELQSFIEAMLTSDWIAPKKLKYFYKVLDRPGIELDTGGYLRMLANFMAGLETDEEFQSIDVCGIVNKLAEKNSNFIDLDVEGFLSLCYRYDLDYKHKLFQILIDNNVDLNYFHFIYMSIVNDPEFTVYLLPYFISNNPIDILKCVSSVKRVDIPMLKLLKSILRLCTPSFKLRQDCIKHLKLCDVVGSDCCCYAILIASLEFPCKKYIKYDLNPEEKIILPELYKEVLEYLSVDKLPTLKELSRDVIRKCLSANCTTTQDYIKNLNMLHLPKFMIDIIQCKSAVSSFE